MFGVSGYLARGGRTRTGESGGDGERDKEVAKDDRGASERSADSERVQEVPWPSY